MIERSFRAGRNAAVKHENLENVDEILIQINADEESMLALAWSRGINMGCAEDPVPGFKLAAWRLRLVDTMK